MVLTIIGWLAALASAEITLSSLARVAIANWVRRWRAKIWLLDGYWLTPLLYGSACAAALTGLGVLPPAAGTAVACGLSGALAWLLLEPLARAARRGKGRVVARRVLAALLGQLRGGPRYLRDDARALLGLARKREPDGDDDDEEAPPGPVTPPDGQPRRAWPAPREDAPPDRQVPSVRDDPALGDAPAAEDLARDLDSVNVPVPPEWMALVGMVAEFEPDGEEDLMAHVAGEAAGLLALAEGVRSRADRLLHGTGLDPAYVAGHLELADEYADLASAVALVDRRYHAIYDAIREWVAGGGILPHQAGQWFGGGSTAPQDAGDGDDLAA